MVPNIMVCFVWQQGIQIHKSVCIQSLMDSNADNIINPSSSCMTLYFKTKPFYPAGDNGQYKINAHARLSSHAALCYIELY